MTNQNNINDKHIRELLKWRLLEHAEDDDVLTQKLLDMEAQLVFSNEALLVPSLQKENELMNKLAEAKLKRNYGKWIFPTILLLVISVLFYMNNMKTQTKVYVSNNQPTQPQNNLLPTIQTHTIESTDSTVGTVSTIVVKMPMKEAVTIDTSVKVEPEKWTVGDAGIKVDYNPGPPKKTFQFVDPYESIPVLTEKQRAWALKAKEQLVKQVIKLDKKAWAYIPTSTDVVYGETVSVNGFYMFTQEVSNNVYRAFLYDLIIQDKMDDYLKAVPDTSKWLINGKSFYEPMRKNYWWHPAYNDFPVVNVPREGASMFCDWLTRSVNEKIKNSNSKEKAETMYVNDVRIPVEEEWLIAARSGLGNIDYPWSSPERKGIQNSRGCYLCNFSIINYPDSLKKLCQCADDKLKNAITSAGSAVGDFYFTCKVNSYNPSDYYLYCMSGNVAEMVWQFKSRTPCAKGGSWNSDADHVKVNAAPELVGTTEGSPYLGFRPVFTVKIKK